MPPARTVLDAENPPTPCAAAIRDLHARSWPRAWQAAALVVALAASVALVLLPPGDNPGAGSSTFDPATGAHRFEHTWTPVSLAGVATGVAAGYLLLAAPLLAYRYPIGFVVPARVRTPIHVWTGWAILVLTLAHAVLLTAARFFEGWLSGLVALGILGLHGWSGARKRVLVRRWGARRWRSLHVTSAWFGLFLGLLHSLGDIVLGVSG